MKTRIFLISLLFSAYLFGQSYQYKWITLYNTNPGKVMCFSPSSVGNRYASTALVKELKYRWGFNYHYWGNFKNATYYSRILDAGYDLQHIVIFIEPIFDTSSSIRNDNGGRNYPEVIGLQSNLVDQYPGAFAYMVDEPAYHNYYLDWLHTLKTKILTTSPISKYVITAFDEDGGTYDIMNDSYIYPNEIVCDAYGNDCFSEHCVTGEWDDFKDQYSTRFNYAWLATHRNLSGYQYYLPYAKNKGLKGVWLWQFNDSAPDDANIDQFAYYASQNGYLTFCGYQYVRDKIVDGFVTERQFVGPIYSSPF